ncbi:MAG: DUF2062 domain-containing protein [Planctomycetota bacterium]|nr:DUF2062 domain-containing protein [Planctomycetota bacterium]
MITRTIGKILRGKATPFQIALAAILGSLIGFIPGFWQGPGLTIALLLLLIILNANLVVAAVATGLAKLAMYPLLPLTFDVGRFLLDGPTQPLFKSLINAPVFALFGLEHYATTGGILVGLTFGAVLAAILLAIVTTFRRRMSKLEEGSERYRQYMSKWWTKLLLFVFVGGGKGKKTYEELLQRRFGNPIRIVGVVFAVAVVGLLTVVYLFAQGPIVTAAIQRGLERANGATVDISEAQVDLPNGRLTLVGLAMADPNNLSTDLLRAQTIEADISANRLLRKRIGLDRVVISEAVSGEQRRVPGRIIGPRPKPPVAPPDKQPEEKTIDDYIAEAQQWKDRLAQARRWLEKITAKGDPEDQPKETRNERIARQIRDLGRARVRAVHLIEGEPTVVISVLITEGLRVAELEDEVLDITAQNLSTQPWLLEEPARVTVNSRSGDISADINLLAAAKQPAGANRIDLKYNNIPGDEVGRALAVNPPPISGGTVNLAIAGDFVPADMNLTMNAVVNDADLSLPGAGAQHVDTLTLPIGLRGPLDAPRISLSQDALTKALVDAGAGRIAAEVRGKADEAVNEALGDAKDKIGEQAGEAIGDKARDALGGILGGKKKQDEKKDNPNN